MKALRVGVLAVAILGGGTASARYLSPEPLLQSPAYVQSMAARGMSVPTYAYALNNPLRYADPTGLFSVGQCDEELRAKLEEAIRKAKEAAQQQACSSRLRFGAGARESFLSDFEAGQGPKIFVGDFPDSYATGDGIYLRLNDLDADHLLHELAHFYDIQSSGAFAHWLRGRRGVEAVAWSVGQACLGRTPNNLSWINKDGSWGWNYSSMPWGRY